MRYVASITDRPGLGSGEVVMKLDGQTVCTMHVNNYDGRVTWCDRWEIIPDLVADGQLTSKCLGPNTYNHVDVYFS